MSLAVKNILRYHRDEIQRLRDENERLKEKCQHLEKIYESLCKEYVDVITQKEKSENTINLIDSILLNLLNSD